MHLGTLGSFGLPYACHEDLVQCVKELQAISRMLDLKPSRRHWVLVAQCSSYSLVGYVPRRIESGTVRMF